MHQITDEEFNQIYQSYYQLLLHIAYDYVHNELDSEDIIQEVFLSFFQNNKSFKDSNHIKYWLIRVTINKSIDYLRHKKNKELLIGDNYINNHEVEDDTLELKIKIQDGVSKLKFKDREIIILYYFNKLSLKDIAYSLNISESTARKRIFRARIKLKEIIENENGR